MTLKIFTVFDSKAEVYMTPFFLKSRGEAIRSWTEVVNDGQAIFCKHPSDFTLFEIGTFDELSGSVTMYESKVSLGLALEFKKAPDSQLSLIKEGK